MEFREWLINEKQYSERASRDVQSRLKRALSLSGDKEITLDTLEKIETSATFNNLSMSVKSQIRRAVKFYYEYHSLK